MSDKLVYSVLLYYKFHPISDPVTFAKQHQKFCEEHGILGRILIGPKGINGTCAGLPQEIEAYQHFVHSLPGFEDVGFKEHALDTIPFKELIVRDREEIVALGIDTDVSISDNFVTPEELNKMIENDEVILFDTRNDIEFRVGHFKGAINPKIEHFRELPAELEEYKKLKDRKIVTYCTGGIRCERLLPLLREHGFNDVHQLKGGIYNYCKQFPNKYFEGDCFVFDNRMAVRFKKEQVITADQVTSDNIISHCDFCGVTSNRIVNDEKKDGRELVICCKSCDQELDISRVRMNGEGYRA